jgi:hypothetical protein
MTMLTDLADLQAKRSTAATAFREHCKTMGKTEE